MQQLFQFHKGAIRTISPKKLEWKARWFQFHKGAIRTEDVPRNSDHLINFNSIKVRLELSNLGKINIISWSFQFHKGAIRTRRRPCHHRRYSPFQFHKGAIRTFQQRDSRFWFTNFNSIKVRLELSERRFKRVTSEISIP